MLQHTRTGRAVRGAMGGLLAVALAGCAGVGVVEIGEEHVEPFELDRSFTIADAPLDECPIATRDLEPRGDMDGATVTFAPTTHGCMVDIQVRGAVLMTAAAVEQRATRIESQGDVDSVLGVDLEVRDLVLADELEERLDLGGLASLTVDVDGERVLDEHDVVAIRDGTAPRITLPQAFVDRFVDSIEEREALTVDLRLRIHVRDPDRSVPQRLHLRATLQPILYVDAIAAKL